MANRVLVVNLNLAVDKTAVVDRLDKGRIYRLAEVKSLAGGKGVNVSRALTTLGVKPRLTGFLSGYSGRWIAGALRREGIENRCVIFSPGESRLCLSVVDGRDGIATDFNEEGSPVPAAARRRFLKTYAACLGGCGAAVFSGRICKGLGDGFFAQLIRIAKKRGALCALDTSGPALKAAAAAGPELVKLNREEFEYLSGDKLSGGALCRFFAKARAAGTEYIVVTDGPHPGWAVTPQKLWRFRPPEIKPLSAVGAGDSFMAGLICGFARGAGRQECLRLALGAAASDCLSLGAGIISRKQCLYFARHAALEKIREVCHA
ncbi:MAG: hexose kinase [Elusimicrobiales bacterium]